MDKSSVIKLATDIIQKKVSPNFADASKNAEALREALIEANGGSTTLDIKTFHRGNECFQIIEEIIPLIVHDGLQGNEFFFNLVDYRNIALGDDIDFWKKNETNLVVADASYGVSGIRRQRLGSMAKYNVDTTLKVVKVYEELKRLLAGRTDFNEFIAEVSKAFTKKIMDNTYTAFNGITSSTTGLNSTYVITGTYAEDSLLDLVNHVEASTEAKATILGTKKALRKVTTATVSDEAKADLYNMGYYGKFNGTNMVYLPQRHANGTDTFLLNDSKIYVIAGNDKPIKVVNVGNGIMSANDPLQSADFTQSYLYGQEFGIGCVFNEKMGIYTLS
ncbi:MAG: hypothetical protein K0R54_4794 [Clostridiaceae bacterium]|jgi:hypothetical protein|nr:hypothetical protein [Clostridiaceae bacterium]